jgi:hypothetical protein
MASGEEMPEEHAPRIRVRKRSVSLVPLFNQNNLFIVFLSKFPIFVYI